MGDLKRIPALRERLASSNAVVCRPCQDLEAVRRASVSSAYRKVFTLSAVSCMMGRKEGDDHGKNGNYYVMYCLCTRTLPMQCGNLPGKSGTAGYQVRIREQGAQEH